MMCRIDILCYISIRIDFWDRFMFRLGKGWLTTRLELQDSIGNLNFDRFAALTLQAGSTKSLELIVTVWALGLETWFDFMKFWIYIFGNPKFLQYYEFAVYRISITNKNQLWLRFPQSTL